MAPTCRLRVDLRGCAANEGQGRYPLPSLPPPPCPQDGLLLPGELLVAARRRRLLLVVDSDMAGDFAALQVRR